MKSRSYRDLTVWQKSMDLVVAIYQTTNGFPSEEKYGIVSQMRRAAVSVPSNIAEGSKRGTRRDFCQFLTIAFGSGAELETQVEISKRLRFGKQEEFSKIDTLLDEVMKMLNKAIQTMRSDPKN